MAALVLASATSKPLSNTSCRQGNHHTNWNTRIPSLRKLKRTTICMDKKVAQRDHNGQRELENSLSTSNGNEHGMDSKLRKRRSRKRSTNERYPYLVAAISSSCGISSMAIIAIYYRFSCQFQGEQIPYMEMLGTFSLAIGAAVGMEFWARWAHRQLWHASLWNMHESHHRPRDGLFELNDIFAIINAIPAIAFISYGFFNKGFVPGLCFGAGLGITMFGMAYLFIHDGLVHSRFPVGPIAKVPYLQEVAAAHQIHHSYKFKGVPFGLFLGPKELEDIGGKEELDIQIKWRTKHPSKFKHESH